VKRSLYDLVGVPPQAPREMVASACRRRIAQLERDDTDDARAEIFAVREAWSILGDEKQRAGYDASLAAPDPRSAATAAAMEELDRPSIAKELLKPRRLLAENWDRYRKLVFALLIVGLFALSAVHNQSARVAQQKRLDDLNYEAEYGEPRKPPPGTAAPKAEPAEPFSAAKFEEELKAREREIQEQVAKEQTAKEDEFREKMQRDSDPYQGRRRTRSR
jgi:curved DNA-binding protein CbpA